MENEQIVTDEQKQEFDNPFPTPKGQIAKAHYAFFIPGERREVADGLAKQLKDVDMNVKQFTVDCGVTVKAQFRSHMRYTQAEPILLPVLQRLDIPQFTVVDGDIVIFDNHGELINWISSDFMEMREEDEDGN